MTTMHAIAEPTHIEDGRIVTAWRWVAWCVYGGWRVCRARWVWDPREGWDQVQGEWAHDHPFAEYVFARGAAEAMNDHPDAPA